VILLFYFGLENTNELKCEKLTTKPWNYTRDFNELKICCMDDTTVIAEQNLIIATRDGSINSLRFSENKNILYLPVQVSENFPRLLTYSASNCSIKQVSKENFAGLKNLIALF
jgi:hypothetical protein